MANKLILILGVIQIVAGLVIIGLFSADYHKNVTEPERPNKIGTLEVPSLITVPKERKAELFGPIIVGILVAVNGITGIIAARAGKAFLDVLYLIGAAVGATASANIVWMYSINLAKCMQKNSVAKALEDASKVGCGDDSKNIRAATLAFSSIACVVSIIGMVVLGLQMCKK